MSSLSNDEESSDGLQVLMPEQVSQSAPASLPQRRGTAIVAIGEIYDNNVDNAALVDPTYCDYNTITLNRQQSEESEKNLEKKNSAGTSIMSMFKRDGYH